MRKTILTIAIALGATTAFAQTSLTSRLNQATTTAATAAKTATTASNYTAQASAAASKLNTVLSLTNSQKPQVASIVTDYLKLKLVYLP